MQIFLKFFFTHFPAGRFAADTIASAVRYRLYSSIRKNPAFQDSPPAAGRFAAGSISAAVRYRLYSFIGKILSYERIKPVQRLCSLCTGSVIPYSFP